jgi:radical SAM superfamily enzyme YgiQ (UPF0313 family)
MPNQKRRVYFNEFNVLMDNTAYLPLVSGLLHAKALTEPVLTQNYVFMPYIYHRDSVENIVGRHEQPDVAAFSVSMWNEQLNLRVAESIRRLYPECLIVFGGPQVPQQPEAYFELHPFIDVAVRGEGEETFSEILKRALESRDFSQIAGAAFRGTESNQCVINKEERSQSRDLDIVPSPYLEGLYDDLIENSTMNFQAIVETNRGCPFPCTFCFWGQGGLSRKYRFHGLDRVRREIEWCARNKIKYIFNADSNFGMHDRDMEITEALVATKKAYGFPEKFRTCFGKNTDDKIYDIASLMHENGLEKGITLSRQSNDEQTLLNIRRKNIKMSTYKNLQIRFNESDVPVYSELILGLPGETYSTWSEGIEGMLQSGLKNQLFVYQCQVYPNTELSDPDYMKNFGIVTQRVVLNEIHAAVRESFLVTEYEDIIVTTNSMPGKDWRRMSVFSWVLMLLHSLKLGFFVSFYLFNRHNLRYTDFISYISEQRMPAHIGGILRGEVEEFSSQIDRMLEGQGRGRVLEEFGKIYWDEEEASFLRISSSLGQFYDEYLELVVAFMDERNCNYDLHELTEAVKYQALRIPLSSGTHNDVSSFSYNLPEFFEGAFRQKPVPLRKVPQDLVIEDQQDYTGRKEDYARETILWGRKSGTMLTRTGGNRTRSTEETEEKVSL